MLDNVDVESLARLERLMANKLITTGMIRQYQKCKSCSRISAREYVPGGLGRGVIYAPCLCFYSSNDKANYDVLKIEHGPTADTAKNTATSPETSKTDDDLVMDAVWFLSLPGAEYDAEADCGKIAVEYGTLLHYKTHNIVFYHVLNGAFVLLLKNGTRKRFRNLLHALS